MPRDIPIVLTSAIVLLLAVAIPALVSLITPRLLSGTSNGPPPNPRVDLGGDSEPCRRRLQKKTPRLVSQQLLQNEPAYEYDEKDNEASNQLGRHLLGINGVMKFFFGGFTGGEHNDEDAINNSAASSPGAANEITPSTSKCWKPKTTLIVRASAAE